MAVKSVKDVQEGSGPNSLDLAHTLDTAPSNPVGKSFTIHP